MLSRIRRLPSPALVISVFALVVAVGGGTFAFAAISSKKVRKISSSTANKLITKRASSLSVKNAKTADLATNATNAANATNATNANNANNLGGLPPSSYSVRSAAISAAGTLDLAHSVGVTQANVSHPSTGVYCINGLNPAPKTVVVQISFGATFGSQIFGKTNPGAIEVCNGLQIGVATYTSANAASNQPFEMIIR